MTHKVYADAKGVGVVDIHNHVKQDAGYKVAASLTSLQQDINSVIDVSPSWLPFAAEVYNISPDINDYVLAATVAVPSDLPNRNCVAFPMNELTKWNAEHGMIAYQTWKGKPTFEEHNNSDYTKAKGVIFGVSLRPLKGYQGDIWRVIMLLGFDRKRDPVLANKILTGERKAYSMGAYANDYECSICGKMLDRSGCPHTNPFNPIMNIHDGKLAYSKARGIVGFECSSVASPAWVSAETDAVFTYND